MPSGTLRKPILLTTLAMTGMGVSLHSVAQTADAGASLEEIIVTATKRSERLKDVPVSVSVLGSSVLESQQSVRLQDYFAQVPGVQISPAQSGRVQLAIRGVTTGGSTNPTVGITVDDVPVGSSSSLTYAGLLAADIDPATLERVEVLRGPQGTLYGAASLGGLLRYVTARPKMNVSSGRVQVDGSSVSDGEEGYGVRGSANIPLIDDKLAATVSGFYRHDPGLVDNPGRGLSDVDSADVYGARVSTLWQANEKVSLRLSGTYQSTDGDGSSNILSSSPGRLAEGTTQDYGAGSGGYKRSFRQLDATLNVDLGWADLTSISGYGYSKFLDIIDVGVFWNADSVDLTGDPNADSIVWLPSETKKFSQEVRLASPSGQKLEWLAGLFYTDEDSDAQYNVFAVDATGAPLLEIFPDAFPSTFKEKAVFGSLTYHFTDKFDLQVGGRASENEQVYDELITGPFYPDPYTVHAESKDDAFTYLVSPRYRFSPNTMVYGRVATGYRPGGPNPGAGFGTPSEYAADTTLSYELGIKADLLDRRLSVDASVYYIDWTDIQLQELDENDFIYYTNAGSARSQGADLTLQARPIEGLSVTGTLAYNDSELTDSTSGGIFGLSGDRLPFSAKVTASLSIDDEFALTSEYTGFVGGSVTRLGERIGAFTSSPTLARPVMPAFTTLDLRAGVRTTDGWTITAFARNVTDEEGILGSQHETSSGFTGRYQLNIVRPRTYGLSVAKEF